jgi:hypothetical protein
MQYLCRYITAVALNMWIYYCSLQARTKLHTGRAFQNVSFPEIGM